MSSVAGRVPGWLRNLRHLKSGLVKRKGTTVRSAGSCRRRHATFGVLQHLRSDSKVGVLANGVFIGETQHWLAVDSCELPVRRNVLRTIDDESRIDLIVMYCYRSGGGHWLWDEQSPKDLDAYLAGGGGFVVVHAWKETRSVIDVLQCADHQLDRQFTADDSMWYVSIMQQGYDYAMVQGRPDQYVIESWIESPSKSTPESEQWTFTRSVLDFVKKFVKR